MADVKPAQKPKPDAFTQDLLIRATHPYGFRSGQWARVIEVVYLPAVYGHNHTITQPGRPVYRVEFVDGVRDLWPVYDETDSYEFAGSQVPGG